MEHPPSAQVEWLDHTADAGLVVRAADAAGVYAAAAGALRRLLFGAAALPDEQIVSVTLQGHDRAERLVALLDEVLFRLQVHGFATASVTAAPDPAGPGTLSACLSGARWDPAQTPLHHEVKAVTYHLLAFRADPEGASATVVVDL